MRRLSYRAKLYLLIVLLLAVSVASIFGYYITKKNQALTPIIIDRADIVALLNDLPSYSTAAYGCPPEATTPFECAGFVKDPESGNVGFFKIGEVTFLHLHGLIQAGISLCFDSLKKEIDGKGATELLKEYSFSTNLYECKMALQAPEQDRPVIYDVTSKLKVPSASFSQIIRDIKQTSEVLGESNQQLKMVGKIEEKQQIELTKDGNSRWGYSIGDIIYSKGYFSNKVIYNIDTDQDMNKYLKQFNKDPFSKQTGVKINQTLSKWKVKITGNVDADIAFNWDFDIETLRNQEARNFNYTKIDFCKMGCQINLTEAQHIIATKTVTESDQFTGQLSLVANHKETYFGTGQSDLSTGKISWSRDVAVEKEDHRRYDHLLSSEYVNEWRYHENVRSLSKIKPFQEYSIITQNINKDFYYQPKQNNSCQGRICEGYGLVDSASMDKDESVERKKGQDSITRTGNGYRSSMISDQNNFFSGRYDDSDSEMLVTEAADVNLIGRRISPLNGIEESLTDSRRYIPLNYQVPGSFDITTQDEMLSSMSTMPLKSLPKVIYVFKSWDQNSSSENDLFLPAFRKIKQVLDNAKQLGVRTHYQDINNAQEMRDALNNILDGSWLINLSHGVPARLLIGSDSSALGGELIYYSEIDQILHKKQVNLGLFAANSCYSGRAALSDKIIGAIGVGISDPTFIHHGGLGELFGIATNSFNLTEHGLAQALNKALGCNK